MEMEYPQPVYFIGIALPKDLDTAISEIKWELYRANKHYLKPLLPHVTLLHPPSLKGILPDELLPRIHEITERYLPLTLSCEDIRFFGQNVAFITIQSQSVLSLQSQLVRLLPPEAQTMHYKRPYVPHITLAQAYEPYELDREVVKESVSRRHIIPSQFTVDSLSYFKRILPREYRPRRV
jgi:2'-5' RNA ligase